MNSNPHRRVAIYFFNLLFITMVYGDPSRTVRWVWLGGGTTEYGISFCPSCQAGLENADTEYACMIRNDSSIQSIGQFNLGWFNFTDPLPDKAKITSVEIDFLGVFSCNNHTVSFIPFIGPKWLGLTPENSALGLFRVNQTSNSSNCCGNCFQTYQFPSESIVSKYNYGGQNSFGIVPAVDDNPDDEDSMSHYRICLHQVNINIQFRIENQAAHRVTIIIIAVLTLITVVLTIIVILACIVFRRKVLNFKKKVKELSSLPAFNSKEIESIVIVGIDEKEIANIQIEARLGKGSFGDVYKGYSPSLGVVAVKVLPTELQKTEKSIQLFEREINIMTHLRHPNILMPLGACLNPPTICLVMEYMENGSLYENLSNKTMKIPLDLCRDLLLDAARGMNYLHSCNPAVIHRDLKSHNLLIDQHWRCKVADFGLSRVISRDKLEHTMTAVGTPCWSAPEVLRHEPYDTKADVYSFAIVMWEAATRLQPYSDLTPYQVCVQVATVGLRPSIPLNCYIPPSWSSLMCRCWAELPEERPTFLDIIHELENMHFDAGIDYSITAATAPNQMIEII